VLFDRVRALQAQGHDIIPLNAGEPYGGTPEFIIDAAENAMRAQKNSYTPVAGLTELRDEISRKYDLDYGLSYSREQVQVTCGSKQAMFNAMFATIEPGDEVIVPVPCWVSYREMVNLVGGVAKSLETRAEDSFLPSAQALEAVITERTKWLILNSPCNPTGKVYDAGTLRALGEVLLRHPQIMVLSDDIYEHLIFSDQPFQNILTVVPEMYPRTLLVNGFSKAYGMAGWRLGYAAGPVELLKAMYTVQSHSTTHASAIAQWAAIDALSAGRGFITEINAGLAVNRDHMMRLFDDIDGFECVRPEGAFYAFPSCTGLMGKTTPQGTRLNSDVDVAEFLLEEASVACMPGQDFGRAGHLRITFSQTEAAIIEACERIRSACMRLGAS
jgi:aspartate aminotransferase